MINETYIKLLSSFDKEGGERAYADKPTKLLTTLRDELKKVASKMSSVDIIESIREYRKSKTND